MKRASFLARCLVSSLLPSSSRAIVLSGPLVTGRRLLPVSCSCCCRPHLAPSGKSRLLGF
eukprot:1892657-Pyramimonas_sp.AAC.1